MTVYDVERIYGLLPSIHGLRDAEEGRPLEALLSVLARELGIVEADIDRLYENGFIETCDEWVVPYIGDLLGVRPVHPVSAATFSARAYVANTLAYRRRKGTATMLEQLARDVTGWPARAVEFFERLTATQYMNHSRPHCRTTIDLRDMNGLDLAHGPFGSAAHHPDLRRVAAPRARRRGRYNIPNVGLFLWRLQDYPVAGGAARPITPGCFTFNPLGLDAPLLNAPRTETEITHLATEINVPGPLRRRALHDELEALRRALAAGDDPRLGFFASPSVLSVYLGEANNPVPPEELVICHLGDWRVPPASLEYEKPDGSTETRPVTAAVDTVLGRIRLGTAVDAAQVRVDYSYGFSGDYGGGPYDRRASIDAWLDPFVRPVTWQIGVTQDPDTHSAAPDPAQLVTTLEAAVDAWNAHSAANPGSFGVIAVMDSRTYTGNLNGSHKIEIPEGARLALVAADWPVVPAPGGVGSERVIGQLVPDGLRPHLDGDVSVVGTAPAASDEGGELILDGLLLEGGLSVLKGNLGRLRVAHTTLVPADGGLESLGYTDGNAGLEITFSRSITGPIGLHEDVPVLVVEDSIIDADAGAGIVAPGAAVRLDRVTVLGTTDARTLDASEVIFTEPAVAERRQVGCVRFSFAPAGSRLGRRYRCQPDLEVAERVDAAEEEAGASLSQGEKDAIAQEVAGWLAPGFTSVRYGDPAYFQLDARCPVQIRTGAEDGAEMGAFHDLMQSQREANLRGALDEYLRAGLEAGVFHGS